MKRKIILGLIIFLIILYFETLFWVFIFNKFIDINFLKVSLFSLVISLCLYFILILLNTKFKKIFLITIITLLTLIYLVYFIYYKIYTTVFSFNIISNAGLALDFLDFLFGTILKNIVPVILFLVPIIVVIILTSKTLLLYIEKIHKKEILITVAIILIVDIITLSSILITKNSKYLYNDYNLYENIHVPEMMARRFGVLTTMRLDLQRIMFGLKDTNFTFDPGEKDKESNGEEDEDPIVIEKYNILDIDWEKLIENEKDPTIKNMHEYFSKVTPTKQNEYTGMFKEKNLILIMAESFHTVGLNPKLTPTLYKLANEGFIFKNFYTPFYFGGTGNGEFVAMLSLVPGTNSQGLAKSIDKYLPFAPGNIFKKLGYETRAYHNHTYTYYKRNLSHPNMGYKFLACGNGLEKRMICSRWPNSDYEMIIATVDDYIDKTSFLTYYVTVSGHLNYTKGGNNMVARNWNQVKDLNYSNLTKGYLATQIELDKAIKKLIEELEKADKLKDTVIVMYSDHWPYGLNPNRLKDSGLNDLIYLNEISSYKRNNFIERDHSTLILWNSEMEPVIVEKPVGSLDVLPTILNLFGIPYDSRLLMGRDALSDSDALVIFDNRSWITERGIYNTKTEKFTPFAEQTIDDDYIEHINKVVYERYYISQLILDNDYYRKVFK